jgi:hypothetical protein
MCGSRRGFGLDIDCIGLLYTQLGDTSNYGATANLNTLQITTARDKSLPACCIFTSRSLVTPSNSGDSPPNALKPSFHRLPYRTDWVASIVFLITPRHGPSRKLFHARGVKLTTNLHPMWRSRMVKVNLSPYRLWRPLGLREVEAPTFSDIRLIDGGKVVSPTRRPPLTPRTFPGTHFCWRLSRPQCHSAAGMIR